jgi:hypothetical protein
VEPNHKTARKHGASINCSILRAVHDTIKLTHRSIGKRRKELWKKINMCNEARKEQQGKRTKFSCEKQKYIKDLIQGKKKVISLLLLQKHFVLFLV